MPSPTSLQLFRRAAEITYVESRDHSRYLFGRATMMVIAIASAVGLLGVGLIFSSSYSAAQVAGQARSLHWTNATLGTVGIARAAVAQAVFFSFEHHQESSQANATVSRAEAESNLRAVESTLVDPAAPADSLTASIEEFADLSKQVIGVASTGDGPKAELIRVEQLEPVYESVQAQLSERQTQLADEIAQSEAGGGQIARVTQLSLTLILPALVMFIYWLGLRRRVRREESIIRSHLETERQMNREKDEFIAGLSHELRTPLTSIVGFSEVLIEEGSLDGEPAELLGLINADASDLSRMVDDLLAAARLNAEALTSQPQRCDLYEQARTVATPYLRTGENIEVAIPHLDVYADPFHLRQIIHNLVSNARRHGGSNILIAGRMEGSNAVLLVVDDGDGIPQDKQENLFERFSNRGKDAVVAGSVGLGLAISQELAMRMGGIIRYSRVDDRTSFSLRLPAMPTVAVDDDPTTLEPNTLQIQRAV